VASFECAIRNGSTVFGRLRPPSDSPLGCPKAHQGRPKCNGPMILSFHTLQTHHSVFSDPAQYLFGRDISSEISTDKRPIDEFLLNTRIRTNFRDKPRSSRWSEKVIRRTGFLCTNRPLKKCSLKQATKVTSFDVLVSAFPSQATDTSKASVYSITRSVQDRDLPTPLSIRTTKSTNPPSFPPCKAHPLPCVSWLECP
jgi:hypothetical protein